MRLTTFIFLTVLALLYAGLTVVETAMYQTWDRALTEQKELQNQVLYFQRLSGFTEQLLRRLAIESQHDPALAQLLKDHRVKVVVTPVAEKETPGGGQGLPATGVPDASATPGGAAAAAPNKLPQPPQSPDVAHP
jgi:hypothetical protein